MATASSQSAYNEVQAIFIELFDRPAATAGYNYFGSQLATDSTTPTAVFNQISGSSEVTSSVTVNSLFENLLGRAAGAPALAFFGGELTAGQSIANIANQIYNDVLNESHTSQDYMVMTDKIDYANKYTGYLATNPSFTYNTANAQAYVNQVTPAGVMTGAVTSVASSMPAVNAFVAGTTVTVSTSAGTQYIEPSSKGIVDFVVTSNSSGLLPNVTNDILQAGAGNATLTYNPSSSSSTVKVDSNLPSASNMSGITTIQINNDGSSDSVNVAGYASEGVKSLIINAPTPASSTSAQTYKIAGTQTITIENTNASAQTIINVSSSASTTVNAIVDNAGKSSSDITTINLNGSSSSAKVATVNLTANGTDYVTLSTSAVSYAAVSTINITETSSSAKLTLDPGTTLTSLTSITADNAGFLTLNLNGAGSSSAAFTFDGSKGSGQDTISLKAAPVSSSYTFTGGTNANNTVDVNYAASASGLYSYLGTATHFQTLDFNYSSPIGNLSLVLGSHGISTSFDNFIIDNTLGSSTSAATLAFSGVTNSDTFHAIDTNIYGTLAISNATGNDTANIAFASSTAHPASITLAGLNTDNAGSAPAGNSNPTTINITSNDGVKGGVITNIISTLTVADGATVNLTGTDTYNAFTATDIKDGTTSPTLGVTFDASGFAGTLTVTDANTSIYTLNNTFTLGSGTSTVYVGVGSDTVNITSATATDNINMSSTVYTTNSDFLTISNTTSGSFNTADNITFNSNTASVDNGLNHVTYSSSASLSSDISSSITALHSTDAGTTTETATAGTYYNESAQWFQSGGNTYIVEDTNKYVVSTAGSTGTSTYSDQVVKLTGSIDLTNAETHYSGNSVSHI